MFLGSTVQSPTPPPPPPNASTVECPPPPKQTKQLNAKFYNSDSIKISDMITDIIKAVVITTISNTPHLNVQPTRAQLRLY